MTSIAFTRASQLVPFVNGLAHAGISVHQALREVHLSTDLLQHTDAIIPEVALWKLADHTERRQGQSGFGFLVGELGSLQQLGTFGARVCSSALLGEAMRRFIVDASMHHNAPPFWLEHEPDAVWLCRTGPDAMPCGHWPVEQYVVNTMVQLVRMAAGARWTPAAAYLQSHNVAAVEHAGCLYHTRIFTHQPRTAIRIEKELLSWPLQNPGHTTASGEADTTRIGNSLSDNLAFVLGQQSGSGRVSIDSVSEQLGISRRSLQRQLELEGTSFSQLQNQVVADKAIRRLRQAGASITQIGNELGYSDTAHFSRAFKRRTGHSPKAYQKLFIRAQSIGKRSK